jgi:hypothetical protein
MHLLISIIIGGIFLFFLARAIVETIVGVCQILCGLCLLAIAYALEALVWGLRTFQTLRRTVRG